ncbi:antirestriction protein ArdA [Aliiglaciecola aliphaticivorans]
MNNEIRIYVACLAAYNNGKLHGVWIDATQDVEDIQEQVNEMLASSPEQGAEEWAIHDYEGFDGYGISEYEGFEDVHNIACFIEEYSDFGGALLSYFGNIDDAMTAAQEHYYGCFISVSDYAQELTEQTSDIPEHLQLYIDYEKMGRDMEMSGDIITIKTQHDKVHIFWSF